ncbi:hypothetical protein L1O03_05910 [Corynebacterium uropygiale]|uniref:Uncharacterized protein n=1 Tax=Corynebacterium uropygiale TaxID=1775911 RepID=A0A9X1QP28_9CORY|nr:hypothetical protein [Corynebacterium uropygiale]MCF4006714.1 hypothetical protein [Corynebacterium uropygiale]
MAEPTPAPRPRDPRQPRVSAEDVERTFRALLAEEPLTDEQLHHAHDVLVAALQEG